MAKKIVPIAPSEFPGPEKKPATIPNEPIPPEEDPDTIPEEDPFENPPHEIPVPGEGP